jgi:hypothetical protein
LHIYADTADTQELSDLLATDHGAIWEEVDGNTANQPLVKKVLAKYLDEGDLAQVVEELRSFQKGRPLQDLLPLLYTPLSVGASAMPFPDALPVDGLGK